MARDQFSVLRHCEVCLVVQRCGAAFWIVGIHISAHGKVGSIKTLFGTVGSIQVEMNVPVGSEMIPQIADERRFGIKSAEHDRRNQTACLATGIIQWDGFGRFGLDSKSLFVVYFKSVT